ncbi:unnamed protein product, partial [Allacma fusca]
LVKENFGEQRTYNVDEFVAEMYTPIQQLAQEYFGRKFKPQQLNSPELHPIAIKMQALNRNTKIVNQTPNLCRQHLKVLRRNFVNAKYPTNERTDFSLLQQQLSPEDVRFHIIIPSGANTFGSKTAKFDYRTKMTGLWFQSFSRGDYFMQSN